MRRGRADTLCLATNKEVRHAWTPWIVEGAIDGPTFESYIRTQLAPSLRPGDVVILDNLNVRKSSRAAPALAERGAWFLFLPKYSPDLNPIEMAFAKLKTLLRKAKARTYDALCRAVGVSATSSSPRNAGIISRTQAMLQVNRLTL